MSREIQAQKDMQPYYNFIMQGQQAIAAQEAKQTLLSEEQQKVMNEDTAAQQKAASMDKSKSMWAALKRPTLLTSPFGAMGAGSIAKKTLLGQ